MSTLSTPRRSMPLSNGVPLLENGDRMTQPEFHRRYFVKRLQAVHRKHS